MFMNISPPFTLADRLAMTLDGLARAVAARSARGPSWLGSVEALAGVLVSLIWGRVKRAEVNIQRLLVRFRAGTLRVRVGTPAEAIKDLRAVATKDLRAGATNDLRAEAIKDLRAGIKVPRGFGWLLPLVPCHAAGFAAQLRLQLADPEMVALLAASPQARRVLAPLCRMLGIEAALLTPRPADPPAEVPRAAEGLARAGEPRPGNVPISDHLPSWISQVAWMERRAVGPPD
jgi:hypothetical protein